MAAEKTKTTPEKAELRPGDEDRIREAVRIAIHSCRECDDGSNCVGALMELFRYLPPSVRNIVEDEQTRALEKLVGGD